MTPAELSAAIVRILGTLQAAGDLPAVGLPTEVVIERPKNREHGDPDPHPSCVPHGQPPVLLGDTTPPTLQASG